MAKRKTIDEVLKALELCGPGFYNGACQKCPFLKDCMPGDNDRLIEEAAHTIETLLRTQAETVKQLARLAGTLQGGNITVYIVGHKYRHGREEWWINRGRFRASDLDKLGKTVFLNYGQAKAEMERLQHGYK